MQFRDFVEQAGGRVRGTKLKADVEVCIIIVVIIVIVVISVVISIS